MQVKLRKLVSLTAGIIIGNVIAETFILKNSPESPSGFVLVSDGIGMDEVARALSGVASALALDKALSMVWKG